MPAGYSYRYTFGAPVLNDTMKIVSLVRAGDPLPGARHLVAVPDGQGYWYADGRLTFVAQSRADAGAAVSWGIHVHEGGTTRTLLAVGDAHPGGLPGEVVASHSVPWAFSVGSSGVLLLAEGTLGTLGLYLVDAEGSSVVVDNRSPAPDGLGRFSNFGAARSAYGVTVFAATVESDNAQSKGGEAECLAEALCVSGALPGRAELMVRLVGPRPNGRIWPVISRLTMSQVEVWIEQLATGDTRYYLLPAATPGSSTLDGLFDRKGFVP